MRSPSSTISAIALLLGPLLVSAAAPAWAQSVAPAADDSASEKPAPTPQAPADGPASDEPASEPDNQNDDAPDALSAAELAELEAELGATLDADAAELADARPSAPASSNPVAAAAGAINLDLAFIADVALAYFSTEEPLQVGGHDPNQTGFTLQQLELAIASAVDPYFRVDGNIVFSLFGVEIEEIYATTTALPGSLQVRVGQFLTRFGRINATHPHTWNFVDQTLAIGRVFGGEGNRGLGVELSYLTPLPWYVELIASTTDARGAATARSFFGADAQPVRTALDFQHTLAIKQFFPLNHDWSLLWGLSLAGGPNATGHDNRSDVYGTDLFLKYRPITGQGQGDMAVELQAEWLYRRRQVPRNLLDDHTGYAHLLWRMNKRWSTGLRYEIGLPSRNRRGEVGDDDLNPEWTATRQRLSGSFTYHPTEFSRLRAQASVDAPGWLEQPIYALMLACEFSIGAHGAHAF